MDCILKESLNYKHFSRVAGVTDGYGPGRVDNKLRTGKVYFPIPEKAKKTFNILHSIFSEKYFDLPVDFSELPSIQYVCYDKKEFFNWHSDTVYGTHYLLRSFTMSVNISNETDYEGGDLLIKHNNKTLKLEKEIGSYIIFPSFLKHTAKPVLSGKREAIVVWSMTTEKDVNYLKKTYEKMYGVPR